MAELQLTFITVALNSQKETSKKVSVYEYIGHVSLQNELQKSPPNEKGKY